MLQHRVFIVEDDPSWQDIFRESIEDLNYAEVEGERKKGERYIVQVASSYEEADAKLDRQHFHLALIDLRLQEDAEELEGIKLVQKIAELDEGTSTIIVSGYADATIATELLKRWNAFYVIEKEKLDAKQFAKLAKGAVSQAKNQYRTKFESAIDFLRGNQDIFPWVAKVLQAVLPTDRISDDDHRQLRNLLNELLADLYPLLHHRMDKGAIIDSEAGVVSARCWSKALGVPILVRFGRRELIDREVEDIDTRPEALVQRVFTQIKRDQIVADFRGIVYVPAYPPFDDFERSME